MTKHGVHKNKASKGPAESEVSPTEEVGDTMDDSTSAQADGGNSSEIRFIVKLCTDYE